MALGAVVSIAFLLSLARSPLTITKETLCLIGFFIWSLVSTLFCEIPGFAAITLRTQFLILVMVIIISHCANRIQNIVTMFMSALLGIAVVAISAVATGEYQRAEYTTDRAAGLALNANTFALALLFGIAILLYLFRVWRNLLSRAFIVMLLLVSARLIIASGSRKGFLGLFVILCIWFWCSYRRDVWRKPGTAFAVICVFAGVGVFAAIQLQGTFLAKRLQKLQDVNYEGAGGSVGIRRQLIQEGIRFTMERPLYGYGPNHFRVHSITNRYAHNNYAEVFANTGIPGGMMYYFIYCVLLNRLWRLRQFELGTEEREFVNLSWTIVIYHLLVQTTVVTYSLKIDWIILAILSGFTTFLYRRSRQMTLVSAKLLDDEATIQAGRF